MASPAASPRIRPLAAFCALRALVRDPDDTTQAFVLISALSGRSPGYVLSRLEAAPDSARLIRGRPPLAITLGDRAALAAMPEGSAGAGESAACRRAPAILDFLAHNPRIGSRKAGALASRRRQIATSSDTTTYHSH